MSEVMLVGAGGIGAPAAMALAEAGLSRLLVVDDDRVELSNLHRQILFEEDHIGASKLASFGSVLRARYPKMSVEELPGRALPHNALELAKRASVIIDATDNFASRFLLADAAMLAGTPIVHAAAVRWQATVFAVEAVGAPCYRCLFEDIPSDTSVNCATAGVAGPVCGVSGALAADRALRLMAGDASAAGHIVTYDGVHDRLRSVAVAARQDCLLCSTKRDIGSVDVSRYTTPDACEMR